MKKLVRITTVPLSLEKLLEDQPQYFAQFYDVTLISSDQERLERLGKAQGVATYAIPLTRTISPFHDLRCLYQMVRFFKREKPDIVHTHTPKAGIIGMLAAYMARVPLKMHTVAGLPLMEAKGFKRRLLMAVEKITYRCADWVYPNAQGLLSFIEENQMCSSSKIKILGKGSSNGIDTAFFDPIQIPKAETNTLKVNLKIAPEDFVFSFVGRLVGDKGVNELVEAFVLLSEQYPNIKLLLVGPEEKALDPLNRETTKHISAHPSIISVGYQNDIRPYLAVSDCFVFPSYREGFPNVVLQAAAMEVPCIVSNINGCNEIIQDQKNGWWVPPKSVTPLVQTMQDALTNSVKRKAFKKQLRPQIIAHYGRQHFWELLKKEYQSQLKHV